MAAYKITPLTRPGLRVFQATLPFQHRPAREIILCELAEDRFEIDLPVPQGTETPGTIEPRLVTAIGTATATGVVLSVLDVKRFNAGMVNIDKSKIIHLLQ